MRKILLYRCKTGHFSADIIQVFLPFKWSGEIVISDYQAIFIIPPEFRPILHRRRDHCLPGYTQSQLNWDYLDYLVTTGSYSGFVTNAMVSTQSFMMGTRRVTFAAAIPAFTPGGENAGHTGELTGYTGQDVQFTPTVNNDSVVISFDQPVMNGRFVIYDIDNLASYRINARNAAGTALNPVITLQATTILTLGGTPTAPTVGTSSATNLANNSNSGSAIISVTGPVSVIKITILARGNDPVVWISDVNACVTGSFPNNWRNISRPFTGMPAYILTVVDNKFMMLNPANGKAKPLFTDPGWTNVNGMAYDPVHRVLYYTFSLMPSPTTNKTIWKYDVDNETIGTLVANVTSSLGIPTYDQGVESGSASFYNGYYYFGVESSNSSRTSGRENTVWRIEFDAAENPTRATQVYAARSDSSISGTNTLIHDWSDIGVTNNAMMYDFDGAASDPMFYHFNLMTGQRTQFTPTGSGINHPRQLAIDWADNVYNQGNIANNPPSTGFIVPYNYNGTVNAAQNFTVTNSAGSPSGSWGDCSEAFRPLVDFGDAPPSYDPDPWSPACHERDTALRIGATFDREWSKISSDSADADGNDEDGLAYVPIYFPPTAKYLAQIGIYNNTGENATVVAWLDYNGNGVFDPSEACAPIPPVPSGSSLQNVYLYWPNAPTTLPLGSVTYLRVRVTKTSHGMSAANPTGYYEDGETEDYKVGVDNFPLSVNLLSFSLKEESQGTIKLNWESADETNLNGYDIERSTDGANWTNIGFIPAKGDGLHNRNQYVFSDFHLLDGDIYYRLKLKSNTGEPGYSDIRKIVMNRAINELKLYPNPASENAKLSFYSIKEETVRVQVTNMNGSNLFSATILASKGRNSFDIPNIDKLVNGTYLVQVILQGRKYSEKLIVNKKY